MIISILICVVVLGYCEAQFGGFVATQNCADSSCNQNNFGRKRRQILEEILTEVEAEEAAREVAKREAEAEELAREVAKREAEAEPQRFGSERFGSEGFGSEGLGSEGLRSEGFGSVSFSATQNCFGSNCNQNNFGRKKREIAQMIESLTKEVLEADAAEAEVRNVEPDVEEVNAEHQHVADGFIATQKCEGSNCKTEELVLKRSKREVIAALLEELL